jgi:glucosamine-6-phosphate deaminase
MRVIVEDDYLELSREAARIAARQVLVKENSVLGFPTGDTPAGMYADLVRMYDQGLLDFSKVVTFNLDEHYGLPPDHPQSYHRYMREKLFDHVNIRKENIHIPNGVIDDVEKECEGYEAEICKYCGIDLMVLGIGLNGHIGFNEPGSGWGTTTRLVHLSAETRKWEARHFGNLSEVPAQAITMGIKTIMRAKRLLLVASGQGKAEAVREALEGPIRREIPASILQLHPLVTVILDKGAASLIKNDIKKM